MTNSGPTVAAVRLLILNLPADMQVFDASGSTTNGIATGEINRAGLKARRVN